MASRIVLPATQLMYGDSFAGQAAAGPCAIPQNPETPVMRSNAAG